jgi:putative FmdB family regulatory protein
MPIFEYRCDDCGHEFEELESIANRDKPRECPACGAASITRTISTFSARVAPESSGSCPSADTCGSGGT